MSGHKETQPSSREEKILELEEALQKTRSLLSRAYELSYTVAQENTQLKKRIEELEAEAEAMRSERRTQEYSHHREQYRQPPMSPVSVPTSPRIHNHPQYQYQNQYRCSPAMATCDGMYPPPRCTNTPRLSPETPEPEPDTSDTSAPKAFTLSAHDEYEIDPAAYWAKEYPKWECKYREERNKLEAREAEEADNY
jgi:hypothetical protein